MFTKPTTWPGDDRGPVRVYNPGGSSNIFLVCEHASNYFPPQYGNLGLDPAARQSHVAWDPGAIGVAEHLADVLDATLVAGGYSRLLFDCNRSPQAENAMPNTSEAFDIPGNTSLNNADMQRRTNEIYLPFQRALTAELDGYNDPSVLVTIHSFTKIFHGKPRRVEIGLLHDADARLADKMLEIAPSLTELLVLPNEPYGPKDGVTHTLKLHGVDRGILNVMVEIRSDLIETEQQQTEIAQLLDTLLRDALEQLRLPDPQQVSQ
ncbi:MAG: N-formylglutamate amidohydrolase [Paracoccaceae bacterium]